MELEEKLAKENDRWRGLRDEDYIHYRKICEKLDTTSPVRIMVVGITREYLDRVYGLLHEDYEWVRSRRSDMRLTRADGSEVYLKTERQLEGSTRGTRLDYVIPHEFVSWRTIYNVLPSLMPTGGKLL